MDENTVPLLLPRYNSVEPKPTKIKSLDDTIESCIGEFGWAQFSQAALVSFAWFFDAQQTFISVFTDADPAWHCNNNSPANESCSSALDLCDIPKDAWAWDRPAYTSIISEWALECSGSILSGLPASSFFMGCLVGGIVLATLADSTLGRKKMLFISCLIMALTSLSISLSTNIWMYSIFKFASGFGRATIGTSALVLSTELVGKKRRSQVGVLGFLCFTLGFMSLPAIAYANRTSSWRNLYIYTSTPTLFYCILVHMFVRESPRWLFVQGRKEEAVSTLKSIASSKHTQSFSEVSIGKENWNVDLYSAMKILIEKRWAFRRLYMVMIVAFGMGTVYYGMPLALGSLSFNFYLSTALNAFSEVPASLLTFLLIGRLNRRTSILFFTISSGICSILCVVAGKYWSEMQIVLELVSFSSACTSFNILLIYTLELFPTSVRNSALSMVRQAVVGGGVLGPVLVAAGRKNSIVSYGVFGVIISSCGLFVAFLPETRGGTLCDTFDEEEHKQEEAADAT